MKKRGEEDLVDENVKSHEKIKKELQERKVELEKKLTERASEKFADDSVQDPGDQALSSSMESLQLALQDSEIQEYNRIIKALEKIEEGSYGICIDCNQSISEKRLKSFPNASRCIVCQESFEEQQ